MKRSTLAWVMGHTAVVALATAPAFAEDTLTLEEINVEALETSGTGPVENAVNPLTLAGAKTATPLTEIPQSIAVIGRDEIAKTNARKVDEALAYTAGVQAAPYGYDSDTNWFFLRGFAATATGAFVDGLQNYSYGFGSFYVDPYHLERIEVLRGASSALYGGSNPGGLVNMVTKRPTGDDAREAEFGVDSDGSAWAGLDYQGTTENGANWRLVARGALTDGNGVFEAGNRGFIAPSFSFTTDGGTDVTLSASYTKISETHVGNAWLPYVGTVVAADFGYIDRDFNTGEPGYDWYERDQLTLSAEIAHRFDNGWQLSNNLRLGASHLREGAVYAYGYEGYAATPADSNNYLQRVIFDHDTKAKTIVNDTRLENSFDTGAVEHKVMVGLDMRYFQMDQVQSSAAWPDAATLLSATDPAYGATQPATAPYADNIITQTQVGLYVQDQMRWGNGWIMTGNLRHDWVETDVTADRTSGAAGSARSDNKWSWRLGLAHEFDNGVTPYVSASTYFNPQVETSVAGSTISPETGRQFEIGAKWASLDGLSFVGVSAFNIQREGILQSVYNTGTFAYDYYQLGEVTSEGLELEAQHDFGNGIAVKLAVTSMDVDITNDVDTGLIGKTPYSIIEDQAAISVDWTPKYAPDLRLTGGVRWMGASWADNANTYKVPDVLLVDLGAAYEFNDGWVANIAINNVADTTYVASCQTELTCYYGAGRTVSFAVRHTF